MMKHIKTSSTHQPILTKPQSSERHQMSDQSLVHKSLDLPKTRNPPQV